jgi:hypothetical protein
VSHRVWRVDVIRCHGGRRYVLERTIGWVDLVVEIGASSLGPREQALRRVTALSVLSALHTPNGSVGCSGADLRSRPLLR